MAMQFWGATGKRLGTAVIFSVLLHIGLGLVVMRLYVTRVDMAEEPPRREYLELALVRRPPTTSEPVSEAVPEPEGEQRSEQEDEQESAAVPASEPLSPPTEVAPQEQENTEQVASGTERKTRESIQATVDNYLSVQRKTLQGQWWEDCIRRRNEDYRHDCAEDDDFLSTAPDLQQKFAEASFATVLRPQQQRNIVRNLEHDNATLLAIEQQASDPLSVELSQTRQNFNREVTAYLSGNFGDGYWQYLQAAFQNDRQMGFAQFWAEPKCWDGPCVFEYTPYEPEQAPAESDEAEAEAQEENGFDIRPPLFPNP